MSAFVNIYICLMLCGVNYAIQPPIIQLVPPTGLMFTITDQGYNWINLLYNKVNSRSRSWNITISTMTGNAWIHVNPSANVITGDVIAYTITARLIRRNGSRTFDVLSSRLAVQPNVQFTDTTQTLVSTASRRGTPSFGNTAPGGPTQNPTDLTPVFGGIVGVVSVVCVTTIILCCLRYRFGKKETSGNTLEEVRQSRQNNANESAQIKAANLDQRNKMQLPKVKTNNHQDQSLNNQYDYLYGYEDTYTMPTDSGTGLENGQQYEHLSRDTELSQNDSKRYDSLKLPHTYLELR